ncbi:MAG: IS3 family transposase [Gammaproteobacteria bacterium]
MKFQFINEHRKEFHIEIMCAVFSVSRAGFYAWCKRPESQRKCDDKRFLALIKTSFKKGRETYGYRRIHDDLRDQNEPCGKYRVARLMREHNIRVKTRRKFKVTTDSNHQKPIHENHLSRQFYAASANQRWVSDITYIPTVEGWLYLAVVMDLYSRKIVGWSMSNRMKEILVIDALKMALLNRKISPGLLLHSDRGSQYAAEDFQQLLRHHHIKCSMSRRGDCWDNAAMESFFHSLKTECVYHERYQTREEAKKSVFDYIEVFYNRQRKHSYLGYKAPEQYEKIASGF